MKILGIDPGIGRTGWGIITVENAKVKVESYGCVETVQKSKVEQRLRIIYQQISKIMGESKPDIVAVEELFFNTNVTTAMAVGQARGVVLLCAALGLTPIAVYTPLQVKIALTGYGRAEKKQVEQMVKMILKLEKVPKPDDISDALAVALTHAFSRKRV